MRTLAIFLLCVVMPIAVFAFKISEQAGFDSYTPPKVHVSTPPLAHPPLAFTQDVIKAKAYWAARNVTVPCDTIKAYVVTRVPTADAADAGAEANDCRIFMRRGWYDEVINAYPDHFCGILFHEIGHISGIGHSPDPRSLMHAGLLVIPKECE